MAGAVMSGKSQNCTHTTSLSLSMIVRDEERFLEGCLESVSGIVDEIVIVDTGSVDRTKAIGARFGAKIFDCPWTGDFAAARNFSLGRCTGDWVLYLDADERIVQGQESLLRQLMMNSDASAYDVSIEGENTSEQGTVRQVNTYPRLFRRVPGVKFEGRIHEQLAPSLQRLHRRIVPSAVRILHLGYAQGAEVLKQKAVRNMSILRTQLREHPRDAYAHFQLGNSLAIARQYEEAERELAYAAASSNLPAACKAVAHNLMAEVELRQGRLPAAIAHSRKSLQIAPGQRIAHWFLALAFCDDGNFSDAIRELETVEYLLRAPSSGGSQMIAGDILLTREEVLLKLGYCYEKSGKTQQAIETYGRVVTGNRKSDEAAIGFLRCAEQSGDKHAAMNRLVAQKGENSNLPGWLFLLAWYSHDRGDPVGALKRIDHILTIDACNVRAHVLSIRWRMEMADLAGAGRMVSIAEEKGLKDIELHKCGLELSLKKGDVDSAFHQLELMAAATTADLTPLRERIAAIAGKITCMAAS